MAVVDEARTESRPLVPLWRLLTVGLVGGALSGLLGIGGGTVMVPMLVLWVGLSQRLAHAVSLGAIVPISIVAIGTYGVAGAVDWKLAASLIAGSLLGARTGAGLLSRLSEPILKLLFGSFLLVAAAMILAKR